MKNILIAGMLAAVSLNASAEGWKFAPLLSDKSFKLEPTLAITANHVDLKDSGNDTGYGLDFNFNCGLVQDPQNRIRTHINLGHFNENGVKVNSFELSPRYMVPVGSGLSVGAGPSLAAYRVNGRAGYDETLLALGVAAGVNYRSGAFFMGADVRYHDTEHKRGADFDSWTVGVKAGINF